MELGVSTSRTSTSFEDPLNCEEEFDLEVFCESLDGLFSWEPSDWVLDDDWRFLLMQIT